MEQCYCPCCKIAEIHAFELKIAQEETLVSLHRSVLVALPDFGFQNLKERHQNLLEIAEDNLKLLRVLLSESQKEFHPSIENVSTNTSS